MGPGFLIDDYAESLLSNQIIPGSLISFVGVITITLCLHKTFKEWVKNVREWSSTITLCNSIVVVRCWISQVRPARGKRG
ncbi:hypothetical protein BO79DRAFT_34283 [Aspergillus costaricaensis CBS 115574]|uniref:Uncharacterized protein n=1 Tax=Aspergillus costaricaensis CBS 115574 TaxID=1448317 RepID=A0ACD1I944_9EURO|nr:hypothetical protein BO79DRAFT_34283 [Aspergillus costaricaensis CBS 115574]RAK87034.1 hypothetical protein BO79DRAFT_34283 [Aspergillus costaricaensis CBS 115574]